MKFWNYMAKEIKRKLSENFAYDPSKPFLERYGPHGYGPAPNYDEEEPDVIYHHREIKKDNTPDLDDGEYQEQEIASNTDLDENVADLYMEKQTEYKQMLIQQMAWQREKEQQELWLQGEKERFAYELECRRLNMEKEIRIYELELHDKSLTYQQQIEIESLKMEIFRLRNLLENVD